ncbi:2OG-Fe(II) oxygenase [Sphingomonas oligophenolica]|nr:2OG-Fe(II) oxygenase family protein [Sphingomonas oligophenolica]
MTLQLDPGFDPTAYAMAYAAHGRVRISGLLDEDSAEALYYGLKERQDWWHLTNTVDGVLKMPVSERATMKRKRRRRLDQEAFERARRDFQYRYESLHVPTDISDRERDADVLHRFAALMASDAMAAVLRTITGVAAPVFSDGHATAYGPGDFLTVHDDDVPGKNRVAAYVYGLTPLWRPEWGGILFFHGDDDASVSGLVPRFNTLDLFAVPQRHSVSLVTPSAVDRRYAITGWLS